MTGENGRTNSRLDRLPIRTALRVGRGLIVAGLIAKAGFVAHDAFTHEDTPPAPAPPIAQQCKNRLVALNSKITARVNTGIQQQSVPNVSPKGNDLANDYKLLVEGIDDVDIKFLLDGTQCADQLPPLPKAVAYSVSSSNGLTLTLTAEGSTGSRMMGYWEPKDYNLEDIVFDTPLTKSTVRNEFTTTITDLPGARYGAPILHVMDMLGNEAQITAIPCEFPSKVPACNNVRIPVDKH